MLLNELHFEQYLNALAFEIYLDKDVFDILSRSGLKIEQWPDKFVIKQLLQEFIYHAQKESWIFSQQMLNEKFSILEKYELKDDIDRVYAIYDFNLKYYLGKYMALDVLKDPFMAYKIAEQFLSSTTSTIKPKSLKQSVIETTERNLELVKRKMSKIIIPDFPILSNFAGGFNPGRISLLTAVSGYGKTTIAMNLAESVSKVMTTIYFNLEMNHEDFSAKFVQKSCNISANDWGEGNYISEKKTNDILEYTEEIDKKFPFEIISDRSIAMNDIESICYNIFKDTEMGFVIIDYDQKLDTTGYESEWYGMLKIIERLEKMAFKLNCHILILSQANEEGNIKSSARAMQPASLVVNFHKTAAGKHVITCKKNRFGPNDFEVEVDYDPRFSSVIEKGINYDIPNSNRGRFK